MARPTCLLSPSTCPHHPWTREPKTVGFSPGSSWVLTVPHPPLPHALGMGFQCAAELGTMGPECLERIPSDALGCLVFLPALRFSKNNEGCLKAKDQLYFIKQPGILHSELDLKDQELTALTCFQPLPPHHLPHSVCH